jgi:hypothetical protein
LALLTQSTVTVHLPTPAATPHLGEREVTISLLHVSKLEPILPAAPSSGNGSAG